MQVGLWHLLRVTFVVLDEADQMLERDFATQVKRIMSQVRPDRQVLLSSQQHGSRRCRTSPWRCAGPLRTLYPDT